MKSALTPVRVGAIAAEILRHDGEVDVVAVFERSFYVAAPSGYVCIAMETLGDGPLNVVLSGDRDILDWSRVGVTREAKGELVKGHLFIGDQFSLMVTSVPVWLPPPWPKTSNAKIAAGLAALRQYAPQLCPAEGLSRLVIGATGGGDLTAQAATDPIHDLRLSLTQSLASSRTAAGLARSATLLVGLGPGLTPSGDDLLGGVLLVLSALGRTALRDELWAMVAPELDLLTVGISAAHLAAAADGMASSTVHSTLHALLSADNVALSEHLRALQQIGHSSGFDTLAGLVLACEAFLAAAVPGLPTIKK